MSFLTQEEERKKRCGFSQVSSFTVLAQCLGLYNGKTLHVPHQDTDISTKRNFQLVFNQSMVQRIYKSSINCSQSGRQTPLYLMGPSAVIFPCFSSALTSTEIKSCGNRFGHLVKNDFLTRSVIFSYLKERYLGSRI